MAAPCDLREAAPNQDVKIDARSDSNKSVSSVLPNEGATTKLSKEETAVRTTETTTSVSSDAALSTGQESRVALESELEGTGLQASTKATLDSCIQISSSTVTAATTENISVEESDEIRPVCLDTSSSAGTGSMSTVLMAAMNPACQEPVIRNVLQTSAGTEFQTPSVNLISDSASEESRVFLENVLQAAAERDSSQRVLQMVTNEERSEEEMLTDRERGGDKAVPGDSEKNYRVVMEVGIQANDYDIERRSGKLPARHRIIPAKFRDYKNPAESEEDNGDSDFEPYMNDVIAPVKKRKSGKRGRPRKESVTLTSDAKVENIEALGRIIKTSTGYKCPRCGKVFTQKGNLKVHMWTHTAARPFPCDVEGCNKSYRSNESLRRHKLVHMGIKPYECEECKRTFASNVALKEHMTIHDNTKPYTCDVCTRSFRQVSCFRRHLITHTTTTPFACHVCQRRFTQMVYLRSHMKVHTGERPFQCDKCSKAFAHQSDLARHKIIHTGNKPYECSVCSAKFSDPSSRRRHIREHMNTRPFECSVCGEKFKRQNQIRAHVNRWHNGSLGQAELSEPLAQVEQGQQIHLEEAESLDNPNDSSTVVNIMIPETDDKSLGQIDVEALANQRKIVSLIQNLNTGYVVQEVEISSPANQNAEEIDQLETVTQNVKIVPREKHLEIPVSNSPSVRSEDGNVEKTLIAIAEVQEDEKGENSAALPVECAYQIIQELADGGDENQIYEIQYQTSDNQMETSIVQLDSRQPDTMTEQDMASATLSATTTDGVDHVKEPDFASQEYFNWLSNFTELCKVLKMPLTHLLFEKISQVHKSITDFMAKPSGVLNDKENFRVLMSISKDLNNIISNHLAYVMESMDS